ncbi:MAG: S-layer homology domain-containing protein, partial [Clostridiales bacterium]|nr:S-layer homology domain-containing protein [Clostridiales bacterium]
GPMQGAKVIVTADFDGDGEVDFIVENVTAIDGTYSIEVPKGETEYEIEIIKPIVLNEDDEPIFVSYRQKANAEEIVGDEGEEIGSIGTFAGLIIMKDANGKNIIAGKDGKDIRINELTADGNVLYKDIIDKNTGLFSIEGLSIGEKHEFLITMEADNRELILGKIVITLTDRNEIRIHEELIDPYGTIKDASTGKVLDGVKVELFYADTVRNKANSIVSYTSVPMPGITDFEPNDNANPQISTKTLIWNGDPAINDWANYAWMVFNNIDYYIVATKLGYETYRSPDIAVDGNIIKHSFYMIPLSGDDGGGGKGSSGDGDSGKGSKGGGKVVTPVSPKEEPKPEDGLPVEDAIELSADQRLYLEETDGELEIKYVSTNENGKNGLHRRYIQGVPGGEFKPDNNITRAEIAVAFSRILKLEDLVKGEVLYDDVDLGAWHARGVEAASKEGLFHGTGDGYFRPVQAITRGELATVIARFLKLPDEKLIETKFKDTVNHWAFNYIAELYRNNIVTGYADGIFRPGD